MTFVEQGPPVRSATRSDLASVTEFAKIGEFFPPGGEIPVTTMWRDVR